MSHSKELSGFEFDKRYKHHSHILVSFQISRLLASKVTCRDSPVAKYVENLRPDQWFNDNNISYVYEYLEKEHLCKLHLESEIVLFRPSMAYLLLHTDDPLSLKSVLPPLEGAKYVFLPLNDNPDVEAIEGGFHWALLVADIRNLTIHYFDSIAESNMQTAIDTSRRLASLLNKKVRLIEASTPQQDNGSDCGVMVCQITALLVGRMIGELRRAPGAIDSSQGNHVYPSDHFSGLRDINLSATLGRVFIMNTILDLAKNGGLL